MTTTLGTYQYTIDPAPTFTVHIWGNHNSDPSGPELCLQPHNPIEGNPAWADEKTAEAWAVQTINDLMNPPAPAPAPTPTAAEIQAAQTILAASGYTISAPTNTTSAPTSTTTVTTPNN